MERIEELQRGGGSITGVASGFKDLDELTAGFQPSDLIIVAGRPSMGKTAFVLNIAQNAALDHNVPVAFFSLEMSKEQLVQRLLTSEGRVDAQRLRKGKLHDDEFVRLGRAAGILSHAPIWIDDTPSMTLLEMRSKARRLKIDNNIGMIVIDYLQLMQGPTNTESRQQEISYISRSLKALARELQRSGRRAVAAVARARAAHRREQAAAALRPSRVGRNRAGRRSGDVHLPPGNVRRADRQGRQLARGTRRDHRRQAAQRADRFRQPLLQQDLHPLRESTRPA